MELRHLRYFKAVATDLSFRRAAERLHISHPALSKQIRDLEAHIGSQLLARTTTRVRLTPAGRRLLLEVDALLENIEAAVERVRREAAEPAPLVVGSPGPFWDTVLPEILNRFRNSRSGVEVRVLNQHPADQLKALRSGDIQVAFVSDREAARNPRFARHRLFSSPFGVILGKNHPLASRRSLRCAEVLAGQIYVLGPVRGSYHPADIRRMLPRTGIKRAGLQTVDGVDSLVTLLASCQGTTLLPRGFVEMRKSQLCFRPLADARSASRFELWALWEKSGPPPAVRDFVRTLQSGAATKPA